MALTRLERHRLSAQYRRRLEEAWGFLVAFLADRNVEPPQALGSARLASQYLAEFVQWIHDAGRPISLARHGVLAAQVYRRSLKGRLTRAWDAIKSWQLQLNPAHRTPLPFEALTGLFIWGILRALEVPQMAHL